MIYFSSENLMAILFLVVMEGMLSFDNSIALAATVKSKLKNKKEQKKALLYGIWGAYFFRILVVFCGVWLMKIWFVKLSAGIYLIQLGIRELLPHSIKEETTFDFSFKWLSPFWATVVSVELMDIAFSIDSIGVALAISNTTWVLITGAILGILMMRVAANFFIKLIDRYPILEKTAFLLVLIAGIGVSLKAFDVEIPETPFITTLLLILLGSIGINHYFPESVDSLLKNYFSKDAIRD